jgi:hypothetical protein
MANICRTNISIKGTKEAINYFREKYDNCNDREYPNVGETPHIVDVFGADAESFIDKVGSKWVKKYDVMVDDDDEFEFSLESAWYPPSDMMKEIHRQLSEIDPDVNISGTYWDEVYDPCGVFKITDTGELITKEATPDESEDEFEGDFYWDEVIDPLFNNLKNILNR